MGTEDPKPPFLRVTTLDNQRHTKHSVGHRSELDHSLFTALCKGRGYVEVRDLIAAIEAAGLEFWKDRRLKETAKKLKKVDVGTRMDALGFETLISENVSIIMKALTGTLVVPNWSEFAETLTEIADEAKAIDGGEVTQYITALREANPDIFAVSVCTTDGQRFDYGDCNYGFTAQSCAKPIVYLLAIEEHGNDEVHRHIGKEPSGLPYAALTLKTVKNRKDGSKKQIPHNPMINAGAILACSMIGEGLTASKRFLKITDTFSAMCGGDRVGFNNEVYLQELAASDQNLCLAYMMREAKAYRSENVVVEKELELYFQTCSVEVTTRQMSVLAATLANGGVCPMTNKAIFDTSSVRHCLSLMLSCGMYDNSGEFAFSVGLPAKCGSSGCMYLVVPNKMGIAVFSPKLDELQNPLRGVELAERLVRRYAFHHLDSLRAVTETGPKSEPCFIGVPSFLGEIKDGLEAGGMNRSASAGILSRTAGAMQKEVHMLALLNAAARGDLGEISKLIAEGVNVFEPDYDKRTALHLAAGENRTAVTEFLIRDEDGNVRSPMEISPLDRWGGTPLDDAYRAGWKPVIKILEAHGAMRGKDVVAKFTPAQKRASIAEGGFSPRSLSMVSPSPRASAGANAAVVASTRGANAAASFSFNSGEIGAKITSPKVSDMIGKFSPPKEGGGAK